MRQETINNMHYQERGGEIWKRKDKGQGILNTWGFLRSLTEKRKPGNRDFGVEKVVAMQSLSIYVSTLLCYGIVTS